VLERVQDAARRTLAMPEVQARLATLGMEAAFQPHDAFARFLGEQRTMLARVAADAGLRPE
jgi:tripartite-type tricarboxylate transporter receptor subunit TctC